MGTVNTTHGDLDGHGLNIAVVAARFNETIVDALLGGATATLNAHGVSAEHIAVLRVPGAFELPLIARKLAMSRHYDAVIALGAVIRGDTPHFDFVCNEAASGLTRAALDADLPIVFGVITVDTLAQAQARAGSGPGNKGSEAALVAIEMANLVRQLQQGG